MKIAKFNRKLDIKESETNMSVEKIVIPNPLQTEM